MTTYYLCYNPDGPDADSLRQNLPADTVAVPCGWTPALESNRERLLHVIMARGGGLSSLPCVFYFDPQHDETDPDTRTTYSVPDRWVEHRFYESGRINWNWTRIESDITAKLTRSASPQGAGRGR